MGPDLHDLAEAVLNVGGEGGGDIGAKARDADALGDDLDCLLRHDAHRGPPGPESTEGLNPSFSFTLALLPPILPSGRDSRFGVFLHTRTSVAGRAAVAQWATALSRTTAAAARKVSSRLFSWT